VAQKLIMNWQFQKLQQSMCRLEKLVMAETCALELHQNCRGKYLSTELPLLAALFHTVVKSFPKSDFVVNTFG